MAALGLLAKWYSIGDGEVAQVVARSSSVTSAESAAMTPRRRKTLGELSLEASAQKTEKVYKEFQEKFSDIGKEIEICREKWKIYLEWASLATPQDIWKLLDANPPPKHENLWTFIGGGRVLFKDAREALDLVDDQFDGLKAECEDLGIHKKFPKLERLRETVRSSEIYESPENLRKFVKMRKLLHSAQKLFQKENLLDEIPKLWIEIQENYLIAYAEIQWDEKRRIEDLERLHEVLIQILPRCEDLYALLKALEKYQKALRSLAPEVDWSLVNTEEIEGTQAECTYISGQVKRQLEKASKTGRPQPALPPEIPEGCCIYPSFSV